MAIEELDLDFDLSTPALPAEVARLIQASERWWDQFFASRSHRRFPRFVPSDAALVFAALDDVTRRDLAPGRVFCEWGSGLGTATCLAALLGYEAYGIEIEPELARLSSELARELALPVEILCTSYIPEGYESYSGVGGEDLVKFETFSFPGDAIDHAPRYDGMDIEIAAIDLFFVYPWPDEQELMQNLFDAVAGEGAILLAYHSAKEICVYRKMFDEGDRYA
jgi:hypothetical protein